MTGADRALVDAVLSATNPASVASKLPMADIANLTTPILGPGVPSTLPITFISGLMSNSTNAQEEEQGEDEPALVLTVRIALVPEDPGTADDAAEQEAHVSAWDKLELRLLPDSLRFSPLTGEVDPVDTQLAALDWATEQLRAAVSDSLLPDAPVPSLLRNRLPAAAYSPADDGLTKAVADVYRLQKDEEEWRAQIHDAAEFFLGEQSAPEEELLPGYFRQPALQHILDVLLFVETRSQLEAALAVVSAKEDNPSRMRDSCGRDLVTGGTFMGSFEVTSRTEEQQQHGRNGRLLREASSAAADEVPWSPGSETGRMVQQALGSVSVGSRELVRGAAASAASHGDGRAFLQESALEQFPQPIAGALQAASLRRDRYQTGSLIGVEQQVHQQPYLFSQKP